MSLFVFVASLESARKSATDSNYETTDEDSLGRGKRQHISYNRFSNEEKENDVPRSCKTYKSMYYKSMFHYI